MPSRIDTRGIWDKLIKVAFADGTLSENEYKLLKNILGNFEKYSDMLDEALKDGIIDNQEKINLFNQRVKIVNNINQIKTADDFIITENEEKLIFATHKIMLDLQELERTDN